MTLIATRARIPNPFAAKCGLAGLKSVVSVP
jgi:hypothetical protein